jgi:hypothetical protein
VQYFVSELRTIRECNKRAQTFLAPIIEKRDIQEKKGDYKKPNDSVEWVSIASLCLAPSFCSVKLLGLAFIFLVS